MGCRKSSVIIKFYFGDISYSQIGKKIIKNHTVNMEDPKKPGDFSAAINLLSQIHYFVYHECTLFRRRPCSDKLFCSSSKFDGCSSSLEPETTVKNRPLIPPQIESLAVYFPMYAENS